MKQRNRIVYLIGLISMLSAILNGCGANHLSAVSNSDTVKIVSTIFPQYDWVREITGDDTLIENSYLLDSGIDLHSFQPTIEDIYNILSSDIFIYIGGESEEWVQDVLAQDIEHRVHAICLMDIVKDLLKEEEFVEGMQEEEEIKEHAEHEEEYDEHVWMSLKNAVKICEELETVLSEAIPEKAEQYQENMKQYVDKLNQLDTDILSIVQNSDTDTIVVGDRFPYRYLVDDYDIEYFAAFSGCSAEVEASFETIVFLAQQMDEYGLGSIIVTETSDQKIAETILKNTRDYRQQILILNSMQSVTKDQAQALTYYNMMQENAIVLKQALEG